MAEEDFGGVGVKVCADGCKGIWFECGELAKPNGTKEGVGGALQGAPAVPRANDAHRADLQCP